MIYIENKRHGYKIVVERDKWNKDKDKGDMFKVGLEYFTILKVL